MRQKESKLYIYNREGLSDKLRQPLSIVYRCILAEQLYI